MSKTQAKAPLVQTANLDWRDSEPFATDFGDIYFSKNLGKQESRYVFVDGNRLVERFNTLDGELFTIAETGFGTGFNFLSAIKAWDESTHKNSRLHFISFEKHPLEPESLKKALADWSELSEERSALIAQYPAPIEGLHTLRFRDSRIRLTLIFGDISEQLPKYSFCANAWFLDGFAPSKNPDMWSDTLFRMIARYSKPGSTFSTFTAAGFVRRALLQQGFEIRKTKGFGDKREMLIGTYKPQTKSSNYYTPEVPPWMTPQSSPLPPSRRISDEFDVIVIGGGLAGINTAAELAESGNRVLVLEREESCMLGGSGQSTLIMYSKLSADWTKEARFALGCLTFSQQLYAYRQAQHTHEKFWEVFGQLQLAWSPQEVERNQKRKQNYQVPESIYQYVDSSTASEIAGISLDKGGCWFPNNGQMTPKIYAKALITKNSFVVKNSSRVKKLERDQSGLWYVCTKNESFRAKSVVICAAYDALTLPQTRQLPLKKIRGQVSTTYAQSLSSPNCVLCGEGYLAKSSAGKQHFGATYDLDNTTSETFDSDHQKNIAKLQNWLPEWSNAKALKGAQYECHAGIRCTTPDYQPLVGPVEKHIEMLKNLAPLSVDGKNNIPEKGTYHPGLYINVGHGSKGLVTTGIAAAHIAALINEDLSPLSAEQIKMLHPSRFTAKKIKQGQT